LCQYRYISGTDNQWLAGALEWCLDETNQEPSSQTYEDMVVAWSGGTFKYVGEEPLDA
jgi:hypothetical protein